MNRLFYLKCLIFFLITSSSAFSAISNNKQYSKEIQSIFSKYKEGDYEESLKGLKALEKKVLRTHKQDKEMRGLVYYFKGINYRKLNQFQESLDSFTEAIKLDYKAKDLYYEFGQVLYVSEKLEKARKSFARSVLKKHKPAVSLYYMGSISSELGERELAISYFNKIKRIKDPEKADILQAVEMQLGDVYYERAKENPNTNRYIKEKVLPQFEAALEVDEESSLGKDIAKKIENIKINHGLILVKMRNGRKVPRKRHFIRFNQDLKYDDNVIFQPVDVPGTPTKAEAMVSTTTFLARYSQFWNNAFSSSPEARLVYTRHLDRDTPQIYTNDSVSMTAALRNTYDYTLFDKPATLLFDYDYTQVERDVNANKTLVFNSRTNAFMLGNRFKILDGGDTIFRLRRRELTSFDDLSSSSTNSLALEQIYAFKGGFVLMTFLNYDQLRVPGRNLLDTNTMTLTVNFILPRLFNFATPTIGLNYGRVDILNDSATRGDTETNFNPSFRLTRTLFGKFRTNLRYEYTDYDSSAQSIYAFTKQVVGLDVEYIF